MPKKKPAAPKRYRYQFYIPNGSGARGNIQFDNATQRKAAAEHIRHISEQLQTGAPVQTVTVKWLESLTDEQHRKLSDAGLVSARDARLEQLPFELLDHSADNEVLKEIDSAKLSSPILQSLVIRFRLATKSLKPATQDKLKQVGDALLRYPKFKPDSAVSSITAGEAEEFVSWLKADGNVKEKSRNGLAENTVRRRTGIARQIFQFAVKLEWITKNPFDGIVSTVNPNEDRMFFIDHATARLVINKAPGKREKAIVALARFGGLRVPSELTRFRVRDIDFENGQMLIHSPKTEHHKSKATRYVPLFPELRPYLEDLIDADTTPNSRLFPDVTEKTNLRMMLLRMLKKAGIDPWPKLFQNLRASRETELLQEYPIKDVCQWIGNSQAVAMRHYAMASDAVFVRAANEGVSTSRKALGAIFGANDENGATVGASSSHHEPSRDTLKTQKMTTNDDSCQQMSSQIDSKEWAIQDSNL